MYNHEEYFEKVTRVDAINREMVRLITVTTALEYVYRDIYPGTYYQWSNIKRVKDQIRLYVNKLCEELKEIDDWIEANVRSKDEGV